MAIGQVSVIHKGEKCEVEWELDFASLSEKNGEGYWSPDFNFEGESWYMEIYPIGQYSRSLGYIDLALATDSDTDGPMNVQLSFSLKTLNGRKEFQRQATNVFTSYSSFVSSRFLSRSGLERRRSEFLSPSGMLTVVCTLKSLDSAGSMSNVAVANCSYCEKLFGVPEISSHERKCRVKCPHCSDVILLQNWDGHECQGSGSDDDISKPVCSFCGKTFDTDEISLHEKKCRVKCPDCSDIVLYEKWRDHECQTSEIEDESSLCEDLKEMMMNGINHDLIMKVADKDLRAHQDVLRARSQVFKSMLTHDMMEKISGIIDIPDCDPAAMEQFLCYLYTGKVDSLEQSNMLALYYITDKYDMKVLKRKCCDFIKKSLSVSNICEVIQLALNHTDSPLLEHATEYFMDNALDIMRTVEWQSFMKDNLTVANEPTIKSFEKLKNAST